MSDKPRFQFKLSWAYGIAMLFILWGVMALGEQIDRWWLGVTGGPGFLYAFGGFALIGGFFALAVFVFKPFIDKADAQMLKEQEEDHERRNKKD